MRARADDTMSRVRRILRATFGRASRDGHRIAGYCVSVEPLSGFGDLPIIRMRYPLGELTFHERETTAITLWILELVHRETDGRELPCPEYTAPTWTRAYRWTLAAELAYRAERAARTARGDAR